jgi:hypothetical protein
MSSPGGYILLLSEARQEVFDTQDDKEKFAQAVPEFHHSRNQPLVCFIGHRTLGLTHIGIGRRGRLAGSEQRRLNIHSLEEIPPIPFSALSQAVPPRVRRPVERRLKSGGLLPPKAFEAFVKAVSEASPDAAPLLKQFLKARRERIGRLSSQARTALALQKEAVATAMAIARLDREELSGWDYDSEAPNRPSFLSGLTKVRLMEDQIAVHDLSVFPGYTAIGNAQVAATTFENAEHRLTVILANKLPLEKQTGTDLIYYNETFRCFLMVQYKAMKGDDESQAIYRFPNDQLTEEIKRMDGILAKLKSLPGNAEADDFRFSENPFFLKLCPRIHFDPDSTGLSAGMYLPLDYWKLISAHGSMKGPRGGLQISYRNARRYLDNTQFANLVAGSWIGTNLNQTALLEEVIAATLESGKAAVIAIDAELNERHRQSANRKDEGVDSLSS